ncbi:MAG TPA: FecR domain-containing protein [Chitinophaga sp.]
MQRQDIPELLKRYNAGICTAEERDLVESWYMQYEAEGLAPLSNAERAADLARIGRSLPVPQGKVRPLMPLYRIAAGIAALVLLSIGIYTLLHRPADPQQALTQAIREIDHIAVPGGQKAVLVLGTGQQINLDDTSNGMLAVQHNVGVYSTGNGQLVYQPGAKNAAAPAGRAPYNSVVTREGGEYDLVLIDGTKVKLDAASSIRYPVAFDGGERKVEVTGQAYFEVAHNPAKPFRVVVNGQTIEVLGTHFNVNAYANEGVTNTTLLEGRVKVTKGSRVAFLQPGQVSSSDNNSQDIQVSAADTATVMAWKEGFFSFRRAGLQTVMRQFERWYNVPVIYEGKVPDVAITGKVYRNESASHLLMILRDLGVRFKLDGQRIIILND